MGWFGCSHNWMELISSKIVNEYGKNYFLEVWECRECGHRKEKKQSCFK